MTDVVSANIAIHTALAEHYNSDEPHFRPENQRKVKDRLREIAMRAPGLRLLDVGCGTGFIIHLAADVFEKIDGVDVTPAMLRQVDISRGNIAVHEARAESLPFPDCSFDAASAYSFLDHLEDYSAVLRDVARVLNSGGLFYIDLVPNKAYWQSLSAFSEKDIEEACAFVKRERRMVTANDQDAQKKYGIDADVFRKMEPVKEQGGLDIDIFRRVALDSGFSDVEVHYDWFLGQAHVMHNESQHKADLVESYLQEALPVTRSLFKYVWFVLVK